MYQGSDVVNWLTGTPSSKRWERASEKLTHTSASVNYNKEKSILLEPEILILSIRLCPFLETLILGQQIVSPDTESVRKYRNRFVRILTVAS